MHANGLYTHGIYKAREVRRYITEGKVYLVFLFESVFLLFRVEDMGFGADTALRSNTYLCSKRGLLISVLSTSEGEEHGGDWIRRANCCLIWQTVAGYVSTEYHC